MWHCHRGVPLLAVTSAGICPLTQQSGSDSLLTSQGAFPARLKKVFIVGAPMWFRVPYSIISLLLKEKLRERVSGDPPGTGLSWHRTLLAQDPQQAGLRLFSLCDEVVEAACTIQPHLPEAAEHQTALASLSPSPANPLQPSGSHPHLSSPSYRCRW